MKKIVSTLLLLLLLSCYAQGAYAQFAIVKDTINGATPLCKRLGDINNTAAIMNNGSAVFLYPRDYSIQPWRYVDYFDTAGKTIKGYVDDDMLVDVGGLELIDTERLSSHGNISFKNDSIRVVVTVANVNQGDKTIKSDGANGFLVAGKPAMGAIRKFPTQRFSSITVNIEGRNQTVSKAMLDYLFEPSLMDTVVFYDPDTETIYVTSASGAADAVYYVLWAIDKHGHTKVFVKQAETA